MLLRVAFVLYLLVACFIFALLHELALITIILAVPLMRSFLLPYLNCSEPRLIME